MAAETTLNDAHARRPRGAPGRHEAEALGGAAKSAAAFRAARRHSRRVRLMRTVLPIAAVLCIAVFSWFTFLATPSSVKVSAAGAGIENGKLVMIKPKLSGFTGNDLPYSMTAARATQEIGNTRVFALENIDASLPFAASQTATLQAGSGVYDSVKDHLALGSGIVVTTSDGAVARLKSADVDIASGRMETREPVDIRNGDTRLTADTMSVSKRDGVIVFEKDVSLVIGPAALQKAGARQDAN